MINTQPSGDAGWTHEKIRDLCISKAVYEGAQPYLHVSEQAGTRLPRDVSHMFPGRVYHLDGPKTPTHKYDPSHYSSPATWWNAGYARTVRAEQSGYMGIVTYTFASWGQLHDKYSQEIKLPRGTPTPHVIVVWTRQSGVVGMVHGPPSDKKSVEAMKRKVGARAYANEWGGWPGSEKSIKEWKGWKAVAPDWTATHKFPWSVTYSVPKRISLDPEPLWTGPRTGAQYHASSIDVARALLRGLDPIALLSLDPALLDMMTGKGNCTEAIAGLQRDEDYDDVNDPIKWQQRSRLVSPRDLMHARSWIGFVKKSPYYPVDLSDDEEYPKMQPPTFNRWIFQFLVRACCRRKKPPVSAMLDFAILWHIWTRYGTALWPSWIPQLPSTRVSEGEVSNMHEHWAAWRERAWNTDIRPSAWFKVKRLDVVSFLGISHAPWAFVTMNDANGRPVPGTCLLAPEDMWAWLWPRMLAFYEKWRRKAMFHRGEMPGFLREYIDESAMPAYAAYEEVASTEVATVAPTSAWQLKPHSIQHALDGGWFPPCIALQLRMYRTYGVMDSGRVQLASYGVSDYPPGTGLPRDVIKKMFEYVGKPYDFGHFYKTKHRPMSCFMAMADTDKVDSVSEVLGCAFLRPNTQVELSEYIMEQVEGPLAKEMTPDRRHILLYGTIPGSDGVMIAPTCRCAALIGKPMNTLEDLPSVRSPMEWTRHRQDELVRSPNVFVPAPRAADPPPMRPAPPPRASRRAHVRIIQEREPARPPRAYLPAVLRPYVDYTDVPPEILKPYVDCMDVEGSSDEDNNGGD